MLTSQQKEGLNNILQDYWAETEATNIIDDVVAIADPIETAKYLEKAANTYDSHFEGDSTEEIEWAKEQAARFRQVAKLLRQEG